jgi:hypothetical protein
LLASLSQLLPLRLQVKAVRASSVAATPSATEAVVADVAAVLVVQDVVSVYNTIIYIGFMQIC